MNVIDKLAAILLFISCIALQSESNDEFTVDFESNMIRIPKKCYHSNCYQGACLYEGCKDISCTGGACHFIDCLDASCEGIHRCSGDCLVVSDGTIIVSSAGGSCVFERSKGSKCGGGRYDVTLNDIRKNSSTDLIS